MDTSREIKVTIDSSKTKAADQAKMVCTNCAFPLDRLSGAQSKVLCPRCNTWLDIDPTCGGSCLACHKTLNAKSSAKDSQMSQSACLEPSLVNSKETSEISCESRVLKNHRTLLSEFIKMAGRARKYLASRFIL